jgi:hypothetical protein
MPLVEMKQQHARGRRSWCCGHGRFGFVISCVGEYTAKSSTTSRGGFLDSG